MSRLLVSVQNMLKCGAHANFLFPFSLAVLCCCFVCEEGCECCAEYIECCEMC